MLFHHALDRFAVHTGFFGRATHMSVVALEEIKEKTSFKRFNGLLLGLFV